MASRDTAKKHQEIIRDDGEGTTEATVDEIIAFDGPAVPEDDIHAGEDTAAHDGDHPAAAGSTGDESVPARKPRRARKKTPIVEAAAHDSSERVTAGEPPVAPTPKRRRATRRRDDNLLALPVIVTDETVLLPHMSIPYPIEDDETALSVDRAMRMNPRLVLVLTERRVQGDIITRERETGPSPDLIDLMTELIEREIGDFESLGLASDADSAEDANSDGPNEATTESDDPLREEHFELCEVGVIAEVGQYISRPGGQDHIILQGIARGVVQEIIQDQPYVAAKVRRVEEISSDSTKAEAAMAAVLRGR